MKFKDIKEVIQIFYTYAVEYKNLIIIIFFIQTLSSLIISTQPVILAGVVDTIISDFTIQEKTIENKDNYSDKINYFNLNTIGENISSLVNNLFIGNSDRPLFAITILLSIYLFSVTISSFFSYLGSMMGIWVKLATSVNIRSIVLSHIIALGVPFINRSKSGELISRLVTDADNTAHGVGPFFSSLFTNLSLLIIYSIFLASTNYIITFAAIGLFTLQFILMRLIRKPIRERDSRVYDTKAALSGKIQEILSNMRYIKTFNADDYQTKGFVDDLEEIKKSEFSSSLLKNLINPIKLIIDNVALVGIVLVVSYFLHYDQISITGATLYIVVGRLIIPPINSFSVLFLWLQGVLVAHERVKGIMDENIIVKSGCVEINDFKKITFNNVNFSYYEGKNILQNIDFEILKGERVAIVGPSGSGKSTLIDLLIRFYDPSSGNITIDGIDLKEVEIKSYRKMFGVVSQETILFNDTIENNIRLGRSKQSFDEVKRASILSNSYEFIDNLNEKFETITGDRGIRLSGGQRQRISIARALFGSPKIIIFDEATSNLDSQSEAVVQQGIENALKKSTGITIAHRLSTIIEADKIIFLNKGEIEAIGTHKQLLKDSEMYRLMYINQLN